MEQKYDQLLDHNYDGIQEYDNPLPRWWLWLFYATIIFTPLYLGYYHFLGGPGTEEEYAQEVAAAKASQRQVAAAGMSVSSAVNSRGEQQAAPAVAGIASPENGKAVFAGYCASCHGQVGEGGIGPNLTDEYWLHGNTTENLVAVVTDGVPAKGMVAWKSILNPKKIRDVVAYIQTLKGTNPPNGKPPQGEKFL